MANKINFKDALRELTGFDEPVNGEGYGEDTMGYGYGTEEGFAREDLKNPDVHVDLDLDLNKESVGKDWKVPTIPLNADGGSNTLITESMVIRGDIKIKHDLIVDGTIYGNINSTANVKVNNVIVGDVKAENVLCEKARLKGNIEVKNNAKVQEDVVVVGDINGENVYIAGKVKGDITAKDTTYLEDSALIAGNIATKVFLSSGGAGIKGFVTALTNADFDEDAEFDLGVDIHDR